LPASEVILIRRSGSLESRSFEVNPMEKASGSVGEWMYENVAGILAVAFPFPSIMAS